MIRRMVGIRISSITIVSAMLLAHSPILAEDESAPTPAFERVAVPSPAPAALPVVPLRPPPKPSMVNATFETSVYGFVELAVIRDSTQSLNDAAGNAPVARSGTLAGDNGRTTFSIRDSRLGLKINGPGTPTIASSGVLEMDFLGCQPQGAPAPAATPAVSESAYFTSPTFRARHYFLRLTTPYVEVLAGQTWSLFGWQGFFFPNTVQIPGVPGELSARTPQVRLSQLWNGATAGIEAAVAAARPAQRNSDTPDGIAAVRVLFLHWRGLRTFGATGTGVDPLSVGVSAIVRRFRIAELSTTPRTTHAAVGWGISVDALLPVIRTTGALGETALTVTASFVRGRAIADQYAGFTGGFTYATLPGTYPQDVDPGLMAYGPDGTVHTVASQSFIVGAQYYLPLPVRVWLAANLSHIGSRDLGPWVTAADPSTAAKIFDGTDWADGNVFVDVNPAVRVGIEYAWTRQHYLDGEYAANHRVQIGTFYVF